MCGLAVSPHPSLTFILVVGWWCFCHPTPCLEIFFRGPLRKPWKGSSPVRCRGQMFSLCLESWKGLWTELDFPQPGNSHEERDGLLDAVGLRKEVLVTNPPREALICLSQGKCEKLFKDCPLKESFLPPESEVLSQVRPLHLLTSPAFLCLVHGVKQKSSRTRFVLGNGRTFKAKFWILTIVWIWTLYVLN